MLRQILKNSFNALCKGLIYFIFAPECLECHALLRNDERGFCSSCSTLFEITPHEERCRYCFTEMENLLHQVCSDCRFKDHLVTQAAAACTYQGPPATMIRMMKYGNMPWLAKSAAAFMAVQWVDLDWPVPDYIIPIPSNWIRRWDRGYNQAELIADELSKIIGAPVANNLKRRVGDFSQAGLDRKQRLNLGIDSFYVRGGPDLEDKIVLLVDDVMTTGTTMKVCAEVVNSQFPSKIYTLTFCRAAEE
jgi:ComF family protein